MKCTVFTLACALDGETFDHDPELDCLFMQYFDPLRPHYARFAAIQRRIVASWGDERLYLLSSLPFQVVAQSTDHAAPSSFGGALLNMLLMHRYSLAEAFLADKDLRGLNTCVFYVVFPEKLFNTGSYVSKGTLVHVLADASPHGYEDPRVRWVLERSITEVHRDESPEPLLIL